ncbi:hypothetical protein EMCLV141R [Equine molluscum contagiosum-like virus]|nr:hypothetical protein EMCLV141R [Equine molluscum contagiosum-like virus]
MAGRGRARVSALALPLRVSTRLGAVRAEDADTLAAFGALAACERAALAAHGARVPPLRGAAPLPAAPRPSARALGARHTYVAFEDREILRARALAPAERARVGELLRGAPGLSAHFLHGGGLLLAGVPWRAPPRAAAHCRLARAGRAQQLLPGARVLALYTPRQLLLLRRPRADAAAHWAVTDAPAVLLDGTLHVARAELACAPARWPLYAGIGDGPCARVYDARDARVPAAFFADAVRRGALWSTGAATLALLADA